MSKYFLPLELMQTRLTVVCGQLRHVNSSGRKYKHASNISNWQVYVLHTLYCSRSQHFILKISKTPIYYTVIFILTCITVTTHQYQSYDNMKYQQYYKDDDIMFRHNMIHGHNMSQWVKTTDLCFKTDFKSVISSDGSYYVYHWTS